jgi:broad specificity phosphatase PhoE
MLNNNQRRKNASAAPCGESLRFDDLGRAVRSLPGAAGGYLIRVTEEGFDSRYEASVEKAAGCGEDDDAFSARVSAALTACVGAAPARVIVLPDGALGGENKVIDERTLSYEI